MDDSTDHLQDKLRKERTNNQLIVNQCNFDIIEKYVDSSSEAEKTDEYLKEGNNNNQNDETWKYKPRSSCIDANTRKLNTNKFSTNKLYNNTLNYNKTVSQHNASFPPALHRSKLNLQKDNLDEKLDLRRIYESINNSPEGYVNDIKKECNDETIHPNLVNTCSIESTNNEEKRNTHAKKIKRVEEEQGNDMNVQNKYNITFQLNKNELAKLQWTNPVNDDEVREIKNLKEVKLHEIRFDFSGILRIQINEHLFNEKKKKKIFNNFDGLYHHNEEPLNSGYTFPEILFLCQSSYSNQVCISLKILKNIFINLHLKVIYVTEKKLMHLLNDYDDIKNKYCFGFTFRRFVNYLNNDLNIFKKLLSLLNFHNNKNVEINCIHCLASYSFPNNVSTLTQNVIFDQSKEERSSNLKFYIDYELFCIYDFLSDSSFLFEGYNMFFYSSKKEKNRMNSTGKRGKKEFERGKEQEIEKTESDKTESDKTESDKTESDKTGSDQKESYETEKNEDKVAGEQDANRYVHTNKANSTIIKDGKVNKFINFISKYKENELFRKNEKDDEKTIKRSNRNKNEKKMNKADKNDTDVYLNYEIVANLERINKSVDDPLKRKQINFKIISLYKSKSYKYSEILNSLSNVLLTNFGIVEIENSCVCLLIGLLVMNKQQMNILKCSTLVKNLEKIYQSKIIGSELNNERLKRENKKTDKNIDYVDINFTYNLITLIRYIIIYNYDKKILEKFDVLSFLIFFKTLPFNKEKKNKEIYFFLACETLKVFRLLLYCNIYIESVDYFHDLINEISKENIKNNVIYKKFLSQAYLYIATYNIICTDLELSGFIYLTKIVRTLKIQLWNVFCMDYGETETSAHNSKYKRKEEITANATTANATKNKLDLTFNHLCDLELIYQCCCYLYSFFFSVKRKIYIYREESMSADHTVSQLANLVEQLIHAIIKEFINFLNMYRNVDTNKCNKITSDVSNNTSSSIINDMINRTRECPFPFCFIIYSKDVDLHFFFIMYIQILNILLCVTLELYYIYYEKEKKDITCVERLFAIFSQDSFSCVRRNIFEIENVLDSYNTLLPLSYLFYNLYRIVNASIENSCCENASIENSCSENASIGHTYTNNTNRTHFELLIHSLCFCSSVPLSSFCLKEIVSECDTVKFYAKTVKNGNVFFGKNSEQCRKNENDQKEDYLADVEGGTKTIYTSTCDDNSFHVKYDTNEEQKNRIVNEGKMISNYDSLGISTCILLFLQKYIEGKFLIYHSKKNIFLLLLKNIFKQCSKPINDVTKDEELIIRGVLKFFLNNYIIKFFSEHMNMSTFLKYFIQLFLVNNYKLTGDYLSEELSIYTDLVHIAQEYIFNRIACLEMTEKQGGMCEDDIVYLQNIQQIIDDFIKNEAVEQREKVQATQTYNNHHMINIFEKNKKNIYSSVRQNKLDISKSLSVLVCEKVIECFKKGYFFNPLLLAILFFFSSVSFPPECRRVFFNDHELIKILSKNVFIYFFDNRNYVIFTTSTYYGKKEENYLIDLTSLFPSVLSFILDLKKDEILGVDINLENYFKSIQSVYSHTSLMHFLFYTKSRMI
ncbi:RNA polymerase II-associated protein 1, putative [Plasmodium malariae]|uniref:RNA polymerase II-associated protein 1, putative n=1 Tax=Plasmodium malariae TaxID=5858 RepID=A0A1D3RJB8_PLAMA|nr:RNA polymerase II-associated protein 1, putative [Plasmodium malariae]SCN45178.1 RNA polymerase II-associated protein 1, putative [Plasmodium malariae]